MNITNVPLANSAADTLTAQKKALADKEAAQQKIIDKENAEKAAQQKVLADKKAAKEAKQKELEAAVQKTMPDYANKNQFIKGAMKGMSSDFYNALNTFGSTLDTASANTIKNKAATQQATHLNQEAKLRDQSAANYDMSVQTAAAKANVNENAKAGQIAAAKAQAQNEQAVQNLGAGAGAGAAALARQTVAPDIEAQQKIKNEQAQLVPQYQSKAMQEKQMQQAELSLAEDKVNKANQESLYNMQSTNAIMGNNTTAPDTAPEGEAVADTANKVKPEGEAEANPEATTKTAVQQANISAAAVQNAINILNGYARSMRVNAWDKPSLSLDALQTANPQLYAESNKLASQYKNNTAALENIRIANVKALQKAAGLPETGNLEAGQGKLFENALGNSATEINAQNNNDIAYAQTPTGEYIPQ